MTKERYNRQILLPEIGIEGQNKLANAKVIFVGAGGLACPALQYLAGAGVGHIGIVDHDNVSLSNLHRQILYTNSDIGQNKAETAKKRLEQSNDLIKITAYPIRLNYTNALEILSQYDIILDCTDNIPTRYLINDAIMILDKVYVYGAIHKFEGQVAVFNYHNKINYRDLFPTPPSEISIPTCNEIGVLGVLPGIIGNYQANEALKIILGIGTVLSGKILSFNSLNMKSYEINIRSQKGAYDKPTKEEFTKNNKTKNNTIKMEVIEEIILSDINGKINKPETLFIDVREINEQPNISFNNKIQIPISEFTKHIDSIPKDKEVILFCRSGQRSLNAAYYLLKEHEYTNIKSLRTSIFEFVNYLENVH